MDMNQAPILEFNKVSKRFSAKDEADRIAINSLSIKLFPGMVVGLFGLLQPGNIDTDQGSGRVHGHAFLQRHDQDLCDFHAVLDLGLL